MSSGLECRFIEPVVGKWYYILQNWSCPVGAWDWREDATCYGPFNSEEKAHEHLFDNHANPGGWSTCGHDRFQINETYRKLISEARLHSF